MATISVSGNKKIKTLKADFSKTFPYLTLELFYSRDRNAVAKGQTLKHKLPAESTLASVRRADSGGSISIAGNKKIKTLEEEFDKVFGLYAQVCYTDKDGEYYYTSGSSDNYTLSAFNEKCEKEKCKKSSYA